MNMDKTLKEHLTCQDWLPFYASDVLETAQRAAVERHLQICEQCRADLSLWQSVSVEVEKSNARFIPPIQLVNQALAQVRQNGQRSPSLSQSLRRSWTLLRAQLPLVRREIWPASAAVMAIGFFIAILAGDARGIRAAAPLAAAACVALIFGAENDPSAELALATPTSPRQILLARMALVFGYNLVLALIASLALLPILPQTLHLASLGNVILSWLGPMAFLSTGALLLSQFIGSANAISAAYAAWITQFLAAMESQPPAAAGNLVPLQAALNWYSQFWANPTSLLLLSVILLGIALWQTGKPGLILSRQA